MTQQPIGMHREDIKAAIRKRGTSLEQLSVSHGYSQWAVSIALIRPWPAVERIIAAYIGMRPQDIWPDRYTRTGELLRERRGWKDNPRHGRRNVQSKVAS